MAGKEIGKLENEEAVLKWWSNSKIKYLHIYCIARKLLPAPTLSFYLERQFSEAGNIFDEKREKRLLPKTKKQLLLLHHNIPIFPEILI